MIRLSSGSADDTRAIAAGIAGVLQPGDVVVLDGGLGVGKTTFVQGAVAALGNAAVVTSPTFAIVQQYGGGPTEIAHVDAYRLDRVQELHDIGFDELLDGNTIVFVEWGERVRAMLPDDRVTVTLTMAYEQGAPADDRTLVVEHLGDSWLARAPELRAALSRYEVRH
ncbi:MAG TPA: tRNA (adenosine(37)-N6)-threonylcarbamoyltransferase complex ATPase subunit type 1 TsaE [Acidimicrobiia bacterium]